MNCRLGRARPAELKTFDWKAYALPKIASMNKTAQAKTKHQASICQSEQHFVWAAVLWRRVGETMMADYCERLAQVVATSKTNEHLVEKVSILK